MVGGRCRRACNQQCSIWCPIHVQRSPWMGHRRWVRSHCPALHWSGVEADMACGSHDDDNCGESSRCSGLVGDVHRCSRPAHHRRRVVEWEDRSPSRQRPASSPDGQLPAPHDRDLPTPPVCCASKRERGKQLYRSRARAASSLTQAIAQIRRVAACRQENPPRDPPGGRSERDSVGISSSQRQRLSQRAPAIVID